MPVAPWPVLEWSWLRPTVDPSHESRWLWLRIALTTTVHPDGSESEPDSERAFLAAAALAERCILVCNASSVLGLALVQVLAGLPNTRVIATVTVIDNAVTALHRSMTSRGLRVTFHQAEVPHARAVCVSHVSVLVTASGARCHLSHDSDD